jgi:hypothetical protein
MLGAAAKVKAKGREKEDVGRGVEEGWGESGSPPPPSEFDAEDMDRYFRTRDELASVAAESEPAVLSGHASLPYGLSRGHGRAQVRVHHARMSDSGDAYSRRRHAYAHRE